MENLIKQFYQSIDGVDANKKLKEHIKYIGDED